MRIKESVIHDIIYEYENRNKIMKIDVGRENVFNDVFSSEKCFNILLIQVIFHNKRFYY